MPLPEEPFETGRLFTPRVDRYGQIPVRTNRYSVPIRLIGKRVRVVLHASHLVVYDQNVEVARHERLIAKGAVRLDLDHYLEVLIRKPGAFPGSTALEQAHSAGRLTPAHDAWWDQARKMHGERDGTRALIEVLLLGRHLPHEHVVAGLAAALRAGDRGRSRSGSPHGLPGGDRTRPRSGPAGFWRTVGNGGVPARVAARTPSCGHQAAALGRPL